MDTNKMMKTAKVIDKILKVVRGIVVAGGIVCLAFLVLIPIFGEKLMKVDGNFDVGDITLALTDSSMKSSLVDWNKLTLSIEIAIVSALVMCVVVWYGITLLLRVIAPMKEGRPFEVGVSGQLRKLAWVTLVGGFISEVATQIASFTQMKAFDLTVLLNHEVVGGYSYNGTFDGSFIIAAVILFLLSYIFRYGEKLQRESDETL
jgi:hypothetical protein